MKKRIFYTEWAYVAGLLLIAAGVVLMEKADFGMSMIVAPAYLLHLWLSPMWSWFTFRDALPWRRFFTGEDAKSVATD